MVYRCPKCGYTKSGLPARYRCEKCEGFLEIQSNCDYITAHRQEQPEFVDMFELVAFLHSRYIEEKTNPNIFYEYSQNAVRLLKSINLIDDTALIVNKGLQDFECIQTNKGVFDINILNKSK